MSGRPEGDLIVGLDVGTSKVLAVVAEILADDQIEIIGIGHHPSCLLYTSPSPRDRG